jgi:glycosyltransferase involved in cell wall biosynthesis
MKDVLFLCQFFYPEYVSSATLPFDTATALVEAGFSVDVITGYPHEYTLVNNVEKNEIINGIGIHRLKYLQLSRRNFLGRLLNYFSFTFSVLTRIPRVRKYKIIVIYSNPPILPLVAVLANYLYNIKIIYVCYDVYPEIAKVTNSISDNGIIDRTMQKLNALLFPRLHAVISLSSEMKEFLLANRVGIETEKIFVIPNWYEDLYSKSQIEQIDKAVFTVSYFGNMGVCQDIDTIVEAIKLLKDNHSIKFKFAGHGSKLDSLKTIVKENNLDNVVVYDFLHGEAYLKALSLSDVFLVSLEKGVSGLAVPSKTYSYMMSGKPIIAIIDENTDIARDLSDNNAGYVINSGDAESLVDALHILQRDTSIRSEQGKNSRKIYLDKYSKDICLKKYISLIKNTIGIA